MYTKKIYFSGGDFNELKKIFVNLKGVVNVNFGKIFASNVVSYVNPTPRNVENILGVEVEFNPKKIDISTLIDEFFFAVSPYVENNSGIFYEKGEDSPQVELHMNFIANRGKESVGSDAAITINDPNSNPKRARKCYASYGRLKSFSVDNLFSSKN